MKKAGVFIMVVALLLTLCPAMDFSSAAQDSLTDGLIAWYPFEEIGAENTAQDASNGIGAATLHGQASISDEGRVGKALYLDGSNGTYAQLPAGLLNDADEYTISTWVKIVSAGNYARLFDFGSEHVPQGSGGGFGPDKYMYLTLTGGAETVFETVDGWYAGVQTQRTSLPAMEVGTWMNVVVTKDASGLHIYRDGVLIHNASNIVLSPKGQNYTLNYIGKAQFDGANHMGYNDPYFNGYIDEFRIYNRALSSSEVVELLYVDEDPQVAVDGFAQKLTLGDLSAVTDDLSLPTSFNGAQVAWESDKLALISNTGEVTRPAANSAYAQLTATLTYKGATAVKTFTAYVLAENVTPFVVDVDTAGRGVDISADMFGLFFEDVNNAGDSGLYGELLQNRSFEFQNPMDFWAPYGLGLQVTSGNGLAENNPNHARLTLNGKGQLHNVGYSGIPVEAGKNYLFEAWVRTSDYTGGYSISLLGSNMTSYGEGVLAACASRGDWTKVAGVVTSNTTDPAAVLSINFDGTGTVDLDMASLFPQDTFQKRQNGLREDLAQRLKDLKPGFLRFPGGCIVEGFNGQPGDAALDNAYRWKYTVGDIEERKFDTNLWGYYQSFGLGFYEYFLLCEDIGAEPVPVLNCGLACQSRTGAHPGLALDSPLFAEYLQDALDLIEFANGDMTTEWGALRAEMGHPEPFGLKYLAIGNEQYNEVYFERYEAFQDTIREVYGPDEIVLITSSGPMSGGTEFNKAWDWVKGNETGDGQFAGIVDEHYYMSPEWFLQNATRYDNYDRNTAKVFAGEYAAHVADRANSMEAALAEAAYMTGLERNADVVQLASYAPLFGKLNNYQWAPNMIWFNSTDSFNTPNYYVQQLFMHNMGDYTLPVTVTSNEGMVTEARDEYSGSVGASSYNTQVSYDDYLVVSNETGKVLFEDDFSAAEGSWQPETDAGSWVRRDGVLSQVIGPGGAPYAKSYVNAEGSQDWTNYTLTLRARKDGGNEGFLIPFFVKDRQNFMHLNLGGWSNTASGFEKAVNSEMASVIGDTCSFRVETGVWYDIKIVASQNAVEAYVKTDAQPEYERILSVQLNPLSVYASASKDEESGDIILKLVNYSENDVETRFRMDTTGLNPVCQAQVLQVKNSLQDINTIDNPDHLAPKTENVTLQFEEGGFTHTLGRYSMTVLRLHTRDSSQVVDTVAPVSVTTTAGTPPVLPAEVSATMLDGSSGNVSVTWETPNTDAYASAGSFTVTGSLAGSEKTVEAQVEVTAADKSYTTSGRYKIETNDNVAVATVFNHRNFGVTTFVSAAVYDAEGNLTHIKTEKKYIAPQKSAEIAVAFGNPGETVEGTVKTFIWEDASIQPLGTPVAR